MRLAIALQDFCPLADGLRFIRWCRCDLVCLGRGALQQGKRGAQAGRGGCQFGVEFGEQLVLGSQFPKDFYCVAQTGKNLGREDLFIGLLPQTGRERQQKAGQVAAVHTGNVEWVQRFECARLIPIIEMTAMPFEPLHRGERRLHAFNQASR